MVFLFGADSVCSERYMGQPNLTENFKGYAEADLTRLATTLQNKNISIIHGTADNMVNYQHTLHLTKALIKQDTSFTEQVGKHNKNLN
jgi:predicted esterase